MWSWQSMAVLEGFCCFKSEQTLWSSHVLSWVRVSSTQSPRSLGYTLVRFFSLLKMEMIYLNVNSLFEPSVVSQGFYSSASSRRLSRDMVD